MSGMGGHIESFKSHIVNMRISTAFGEEIEMKIQTKPVITNSFPSVNLTSVDITFLKENNICLANSKLRGEQQIPHILVGLDHYHDLVASPAETVRTPTGLHITRTVFGPTVYGKGTTNAENTHNTTYFGLTAVHESSEQEILRNMFELEGLGISTFECQKDDKIHEYLNEYSKRISFESGRITAPFPLKENISFLEDNYAGPGFDASAGLLYRHVCAAADFVEARQYSPTSGASGARQRPPPGTHRNDYGAYCA
ncbi:hypothetical protein Y032_0035g2985 [Ancylostoma ceylanicum]|uniref:Peptidase aspartic putative domain-containing protein n=1 Tax=Ancylostoma ceylanicum TaxID=53326 RepID=A0A016UKB5_9BILA|nr:hypothetical protein Y032_0035g2985 [Ancylostoma ceylanicum]